MSQHREDKKNAARKNDPTQTTSHVHHIKSNGSRNSIRPRRFIPLRYEQVSWLPVILLSHLPRHKPSDLAISSW